MKTHAISVTVESGAIQVRPDTLVMTSEDDVQWAGTHKFSIVFEDDKAFGKRELAHAAATSRQRPLVKGRFKYTVVSEEDPALRLDPVIIVEDPKTGSNP